MVERVGISHELSATISELEARIADESLLPFRRDREFALNLLENLMTLEPARGAAAIAALDRLVPKRNADGTRQIADRRISPKLEEIIASRWQAAEVDIASPNGAWGGVPATVKEAIWQSEDCGIYLEMTNRCTVMCDFCGYADKGKITRKASFDSVIAVIRDYHNEAKKFGLYKTIVPSDNFYAGTDPFDARWCGEDGKDLDYGDVLEEHHRICGTKRISFTSTALPIGEELRVLRALLWFLGARTRQTIEERSVFRLSLTDINEQRVGAIEVVAEALFGRILESTGVQVTQNRSEKPFLAGRNAEAPGHSTMSDVIGVNCKDGLIISLKGLMCVTMTGTSAEKTRGEEYYEAKSILPDGSTRWRIPHYYYKPDLLNGNPAKFYPDATVIEITTGAGEARTEVRRLADDPCRIHLRLAAIGYHYFYPGGQKHWNENGLTAKQKAELAALVEKDYLRLEKHITSHEKGKANRMMLDTYRFFKKVLGR